MSRKTRKEKIIADLRRKLQERASPSLVSISVNSPSRPVEEVVQTQSLYIYPLHLVRKDLTKTFLLSILAISLEIALFLVLEKHLVLPFEISFF